MENYALTDALLQEEGIHGIQVVVFLESIQLEAIKVLCKMLLFVDIEHMPLLDTHRLIDGDADGARFIVDVPANRLCPPYVLTDVAANFLNTCQQPASKGGKFPKLPNPVVYRAAMERFLEYILVLLLWKGTTQDSAIEVNTGSADQDAIKLAESHHLPTELLTLLHTSKIRPTKELHRNLYLSDGAIHILTNDRSDPSQFRCRRIPPNVSNLMLIYLSCVLPFYRGLRPEDPYSTSSLLFVGPENNHWPEARFNDILKRESKAKLNLECDLEKSNRIVQIMSNASMNNGKQTEQQGVKAVHGKLNQHESEAEEMDGRCVDPDGQQTGQEEQQAGDGDATFGEDGDGPADKETSSESHSKNDCGTLNPYAGMDVLTQTLLRRMRVSSAVGKSGLGEQAAGISGEKEPEKEG